MNATDNNVPRVPAERLRAEKEFRRKIRNVEAIRDLFLSNREKP